MCPQLKFCPQIPVTNQALLECLPLEAFQGEVIPHE